MKSFLIIGLGRFGRSVARKLCELGNEVLVIDRDADAVQHIAEDVTHAIVGDATEAAVLHAAGARNFDCAVVAVASNIENSVLATALLKEEGVPHVIAKARSSLHRLVLQRVGADEIVFPEEEMGVRLARTMSMRTFLDYVSVTDDFSIAELPVPEKWVGKTLVQLNVRAKYGATVLATRPKDSEKLSLHPDPCAPLPAGLVLVMIGTNEDLEEIGLRA
ncbi:TrkA family potassium uptake protein [Butyricicoccus sp. 1XD8-22]|nr:TrkA family potassium uptake protein [Butyricicoccus sp. 1XD8-22]